MKPRLVTRATRAASAAKRWRQQYPHPAGQHAQIAEALDALDALPGGAAADDVDRIIGNISWTRVPSCDGCGHEDLPAVVAVDQTHRESAPAYLCRDCVVEALALFDASTASS